MIDQGMVTLAWVSGWEAGVVVLVIVVLFFGRRLPEIGRSLGQGITEFKKGLKSDGVERGGENGAQSGPSDKERKG